jgi:PD-(D/E)XK nuclease superfamily
VTISRHFVSASKAHLFLTCPPSGILPRAEVIDGSMEFKRAGRVRHRYLALAKTHGREVALEDVPADMRAECASIDLDKLPMERDGAYGAEVAFAYNLLTGAGRELPGVQERAYLEADPPLAPEEIPGTADVFGFSADGESILIIDWKGAWADVPPAATNGQLLLLALAACSAKKRDKAIVAICRLGDDGNPYFDVAHLTRFDLDLAAEEFKRAWGQMEFASMQMEVGERPEVIMGPHCTHCPAFAGCHGPLGLLRAAAGAPDLVELEMLPLDDESALKAHLSLKLIEAMVKRAKGAVRAYAKQHPLTLPNGKVLGEVETSKRTIDGGKAYPLVLERFGPAAADKATTMEMTLTSLKAAIKAEVLPKDPKLKLKDVYDPFLAKLEKDGALTMKRGTGIREHAAGEASVEDENGG